MCVCEVLSPYLDDRDHCNGDHYDYPDVNFGGHSPLVVLVVMLEHLLWKGKDGGKERGEGGRERMEGRERGGWGGGGGREEELERRKEQIREEEHIAKRDINKPSVIVK